MLEAVSSCETSVNLCRTTWYHIFSLSLFPVAPTWCIGHPWNASFHFSFLILRQSVGLLERGISPSQGRYLHRTTQTQNKRRQTSMPWMGFEPTIPVRESEDSSCLKQRGHCNRHITCQRIILFITELHRLFAPVNNILPFNVPSHLLSHSR
jgi:hypothetical protein